jgi:hypothetical protein
MEQSSTENRYNSITDTRFNSTSHICWRSVFSGLFVALLTYIILSALGAGIGGLTVAHVIEKNENGTGLFAGAGLWLGFTAVVSLFLGSYFATRYSNATHKQIGGAQGILIAALFFFVVLHGSGSVVGNLSAFANNISAAPTNSDAEEAARVVADTGWTLFAATVLGVVAAIVGGVEGALGNRRRPFDRIETTTAKKAA